MIDSLPTMQPPPVPSNDIQYVIYALAFTVVAVILGSKIIESKFGKKQEPQAPQTAGAQMPQTQAANTKEIVEAISVLIIPRIDAVEKRIGHMEERSDASFRRIHERLDEHLDSHGKAVPVKAWDGSDRRTRKGG